MNPETAVIDPDLVPNHPANIELAEEEEAAPPQSELRFPLVTAHHMGAGVETTEDDDRFKFQYDRIFKLMHDRKWRTLGEIEAATGYLQTSISAQLRFMTRQEFGGHTKNRERMPNKLYKYQIVCNPRTCPLPHNDPFHNWLREEEKIHGR